MIAEGIEKLVIRFSLICVSTGACFATVFYYLPGDQGAFVGLIALFLLLVTGFSGGILLILSAFLLLKRRIDLKGFLRISAALAGAAAAGVVILSLGVKFASNLRITLHNSTKATINDIRVVAIDTVRFTSLEPNTSECRWITDCDDCDVELLYRMGGHEFHEILYTYRDGGPGENGTYRIGLDSIAIDVRRHRNRFQ